MRTLEWDNMEMKIDGRQLHHVRFADDIVLVTPNITQAERMLDDFNKAYGKIVFQLNLTKAMFMRNGLVSHAQFTLNGTNISKWLQLWLSRSGFQCDERLSSRAEQKDTSGLGSLHEHRQCSEGTRNARLRAYLFDSTVLPALTYTSETWSLLKQDEWSLSVIERAVEGTMLGVSLSTQVRDGFRSSALRQRSKIKGAVLHTKQSKIRCAGRVMRMNDNRWTRAVSDWIPQDIKRTAGRPPTLWSEFFTKSVEER
ncbi:unnamed protein product [Angiostrongylus costaricensis]|uniref:Reverse transcriptase domain-containing protein n=1 Tax=Angiostrongylus costaricensis TaxID=334426 RepID=A0A0R3PFD1_ANGCS|nr:unnamed protein product [Angiostrongylus costaricensis]